MFKVSELIEKLQEFDGDLLVCVPLFSEHVTLTGKDFSVRQFQEPRPDGWVHDARPDKPSIDYLVLDGGK